MFLSKNLKSRALLDKVLSLVNLDVSLPTHASNHGKQTHCAMTDAFNMLGPKQTANFNNFIVDIVFLIMFLN